jgi:hypothetical protein
VTESSGRHCKSTLTVADRIYVCPLPEGHDGVHGGSGSAGVPVWTSSGGDEARHPLGTAVCGDVAPTGDRLCVLGKGHDGPHADGEGFDRAEWSERPDPAEALRDQSAVRGDTVIRLHAAVEELVRERDNANREARELAADLDRLLHTPSAVEESLRQQNTRQGQTIESLRDQLQVRGCTAAEWAELYDRREAEYQQARSEADDAQVELAGMRRQRDDLIENVKMYGDRVDQDREQLAAAHEVIAEQARTITSLQSGKSVDPDAAAQVVRSADALAAAFRQALGGG